MEYRFKATEWKDLPAADRVRRCRLMADEAVTLAHLTIYWGRKRSALPNERRWT